MSKSYKSVCKKLNKILSERKEDYIDELNKIIDEEVWAEGGELYFDRDVYLSYDCDSEKVRSVVREKPEYVQFEPSDDEDEHPGISLRYKPYVYSLVSIKWVEFNKPFNKKTLKEITDISDDALIMFHTTEEDEKEEPKERISLLTSHEASNGKVWTVDGRVVYDFNDWGYVISKYCPLVIPE